MSLRRGLPATQQDVGVLDDAAIAAATEEVAPIVRDVDELHDALLALWLVPAQTGEALAPEAAEWFRALASSGRACQLSWDAHAAWVATERLGALRAVLGEVTCVPMIATPSWSVVPEREAAILRIVGAHLDHRGPVTALSLASELGLPVDEVLSALLALETDGAILRGRFTSGAPAPATTARAAIAAADDNLHALEWCNRRVLARIHRLTLARLRKEIEPVSASALMRFLLRWQRVARHTQLIGADGLGRVIEQLQGFETAAGAWEREVLPARLYGYDQSWLDQLCLAGQIVWCRLSPRRSVVEAEPDEPAPIVEEPRRPPAQPELVYGEPYDLAEAGAEAARMAGASRDEIAAAASSALAGKVPPYEAQVITSLVTASAMLRQSRTGLDDAAYEEMIERSSEPAADDDDRRLRRGWSRVVAKVEKKRPANRNARIGNSNAGVPVTARDNPGLEIDARDVPTRDLPARDDAKPAKPAASRMAPSRSAPLAMMMRRDVSWLRAAAAIGQTEPPVLGPAAIRVRDHLAQTGASFLSDLVSSIDLQPDEIEDALWELVGAGLATADGFASLRVLVDRKRGEVKSLFDRGAAPFAAAQPTVRKWQDAIRKARTRDRGRPGHALRSLPTAAGRWSLLPATAPEAIDAEASARQLLHRYGVVFRDLVARESSLPPWRDLLVALRRLEARGEIRGGRFVTGFVGEQFALPEALDELRGVRNPTAATCVTKVAATDPLNLVGILTPGPRVPAIVGNAVLYVDGQAVASLEAGELVLRAALPPGARVDADLTYHPPPRPSQPASQAALPL